MSSPAQTHVLSSGTLSRNPLATSQSALVVPWLPLHAVIDRVCWLCLGDKRTAKDNLEFIRGWLKLYPHLAGNPLWIAGESYAGRL